MSKILNNTVIFCIVILNLAGSAFSQQNDYQRASLWEKEIRAFAELDKKDFPKTGGVLFVGSSSIRGWRTLAQDFPEFRSINRGFGGSHLEDVNHYIKQIVFPYKPKLIVLYAGENDLVSGKSVERVFSDFRQFIFLMRKNLPKTRLIVVSVKPSPSRWNYVAQFTELNRLMKAETERDKHLFFADVWTPMLDENGDPKKEIFLGDRLHMNPEGYKISRETLYQPIRKGLKGNFR
jgi:lysophospholipase L1-like esterase